MLSALMLTSTAGIPCKIALTDVQSADAATGHDPELGRPVAVAENENPASEARSEEGSQLETRFEEVSEAFDVALDYGQEPQLQEDYDEVTGIVPGLAACSVD